MKDPRTRSAEVEVFRPEIGISSTTMKEPAPACRLVRDDIGIRSRSGFRHAQLLRVDAVFFAIPQNETSGVIGAHQADRFQRETRPQAGKIFQDVIG